MYKSPEINVRKRSFDAKANDVWSLGVCLFMMIIGGSPWDKAVASDERFLYIMSGHMRPLLKAWNRSDHLFDDDLMDLFSKILQYEEQRISLNGIKQHRWLKKLSSFFVVVASKYSLNPKSVNLHKYQMSGI
eukprot:TRINITY_DN18206_c0_g1_i1.p1 TRINITY_DN18206_c0_g1~~TRINITY_DN18206_c0_g1_i1.p1  ORF type:complete len:141 (+),score=10.34 TRINITY_DN18206_c0_g1_i1:30-425(+)